MHLFWFSAVTSNAAIFTRVPRFDNTSTGVQRLLNNWTKQTGLGDMVKYGAPAHCPCCAHQDLFHTRTKKVWNIRGCIFMTRFAIFQHWRRFAWGCKEKLVWQSVEVTTRICTMLTKTVFFYMVCGYGISWHVKRWDFRTGLKLLSHVYQGPPLRRGLRSAVCSAQEFTGLYSKRSKGLHQGLFLV